MSVIHLLRFSYKSATGTLKKVGICRTLGVFSLQVEPVTVVYFSLLAAEGRFDELDALCELLFALSVSNDARICT